MPNWSEDIGAYLKDDTRSYKPIFTIFTHWTPEDYDEVCTRVQNALGEVGISIPSRLPQFKLKNRKGALDAAYRQRTTAEALLFGRYNHDGLFLLPHQKDPANRRLRGLWKACLCQAVTRLSRSSCQ